MDGSGLRHLYLVRHCETRFIAHGEASVDSPLSDQGLLDAQLLRQQLVQLPFDLTLTSVFQRARQTAAAITPDGAPIHASPALNEYPLDDCGKGMESSASGLARIATCLYAYSPHYTAIAVVAHNSILTTLLTSLLNAPWSNHEVAAFEIPGTCRVLRFDWKAGDTVWRELDAFTPDGTSLPSWPTLLADAKQDVP
jgi:broad specificity phosphatase PhoE